MKTEKNRKWSESPIHDQVKRAGLDNAGEAHTFNTMTTPRTDKERLDWLLKNCLIKELDLEWVHDSRETIDEAMKGEL